jgi:hypothetical protein
MRKQLISVLALAALTLGISSAEAAKKGYGSARAACLAQAGTTEAEFSQRRASYQSGAIYKQCMTGKGFDVVVRKSNGERLY